MIELKNITKVYKSNHSQIPALDNVSVKFPKSGLVSILGPSGSGKTTLLNIIGGLDNDFKGEIISDYVSVASSKNRELDKYRSTHVGFVFQDYNLISTLSVYENILLSLSLTTLKKKEKKEKIYDVCKALKIEDQLHKKPSQLSGGQLQRAAIARSIVNNPEVILADEPTGALDSETSVQILEILKEISASFLVIMVTHNSSLANVYSDRIIYMLDGKIQNDKVINELSYEKVNNKSLKKQRKMMNIFNICRLSISNLYSKIIRSILTVLACSVGIIALCIVLTVANGMSLYISDVQRQALSTYPVTITSEVEEEEIEDTVYEEYPDEDVVYISDNNASYYGHVNTFSNEFMAHVKSMPSSLYTVMSYSGWLRMRILSKTSDNSYRFVSSYSYLKEINKDNGYLTSEYDVLTSTSLPQKKEEIALVIDKSNAISRSVLTALGINTDGRTSFSFSELLGKTYKIIYNDDYYYKNEATSTYGYYYNNGKTMADLYNSSELELKIVAILRPKQTAKTKLYQTTILYTEELTSFMLENNLSSSIVKDQLSNKEINVFTGESYEDIVSPGYTETASYQLESNLSTMGATYTISRIYIYTNQFENFEKIHDYIEEYNEGKDISSQIRYTDYLKNLTEEFDLFMDVLINVLLIFALISIFVAGIMIVIITYVSVLERTKEIGILRSLGVRRLDVGIIFVLESGFVGLVAGIVGVVLGTILINPVLNRIITILKDSNVTSFDVNSLNMNGFNVFHMILLVIGSCFITMIAGLIPAIMASCKDPIKALKND